MAEKAIKEGDTDPRKHEESSDLQEKASKVEHQGGQEQGQNKNEEKEKLESGKDKNEEPKEEDTKGMFSRVLKSYVGGKDQAFVREIPISHAWRVGRAAPLLASRVLYFLSPFSFNVFAWRPTGVDGK